MYPGVWCFCWIFPRFLQRYCYHSRPLPLLHSLAPSDHWMNLSPSTHQWCWPPQWWRHLKLGLSLVRHHTLHVHTAIVCVPVVHFSVRNHSKTQLRLTSKFGTSSAGTTVLVWGSSICIGVRWTFSNRSPNLLKPFSRRCSFDCKLLCP